MWVWQSPVDTVTLLRTSQIDPNLARMHACNVPSRVCACTPSCTRPHINQTTHVVCVCVCVCSVSVCPVCVWQIVSASRFPTKPMCVSFVLHVSGGALQVLPWCVYSCVWLLLLDRYFVGTGKSGLGMLAHIIAHEYTHHCVLCMYMNPPIFDPTYSPLTSNLFPLSHACTCLHILAPFCTNSLRERTGYSLMPRRTLIHIHT